MIVLNSSGRVAARLSASVFALLLSFPAGTAGAEPELSAAKTPVEAGLVEITELIPDVVADIRYAGRNNFIGQRIDGYHAARCYLLEPAAKSLQRAARDLREQHLRLKIFDCYRPARAVRHFVEWAGDLEDQRKKPEFYPGLDKSELLGVYIAPVSGHSRGATIDLTLARCDGDPCKELDMGTPYDFFDELAHTDAPGITAAQRSNRELLRSAMQRHGFSNYELEWWHYTLSPEPSPGVIFDVPVR
jgi:D-alanyl-D-alanine dipeptidase